MFVVFLLHHLVDGRAWRGSGVSMGPLSADSQPPPSSADSAWFLTQNSGFARHDDGETGLPPKPPWFFEQENATELGSRFPFICGFKDSAADLRESHVKNLNCGPGGQGPGGKALPVVFNTGMS